MNFIAVAFGYNQYSIFNTNTSTQTLIDNILNFSLNEITANLVARDSALTKEIDGISVDLQNTIKKIATLETEKKKEEERIATVKKEIEEENKKMALAAKGKKKGAATVAKKKGKKTDDPDYKQLNAFIEEIKNFQLALTEKESNKEKYHDKQKKLGEIQDKFKKMIKEKSNMKIELVDYKGDKVNINTKGQLYAMDYLEGQRCYELNKYIDNNNIETGAFEPLKYDGYCIRTIEEDAKFEEAEKGNTKNKKPAKKK